MAKCKGTGWLVSALAAGLLSSSAMADEGINLQRLEPATGPAVGVSTESARVFEHLQVGGALTFDYADLPLRSVWEGGGERAQVVEKQIVMHGTVAFGLFDQAELGLGLPMVIHQTSGDMAIIGRRGESISPTGTGNVRVVPRLRLMGEPEQGLALGLRAVLAYPTGEVRDFVADAESTYEGGLTCDYRLGTHAAVGVNLGYRLRAQGEFLERDIGDMVTFSVGAEVPVGGESVSLIGDLVGGVTTEGERALSEQEVPLEWLAGVRWYGPAGIRLTAAGGSGLNKGFGNPRYRAVAQLALATPPRSRDPDGDRIVGDDDACPLQPEDLDGFQDADGCPDLDHDGDGVLEPHDRCLDEREDRDGWEDSDGCPDPDNDGDGIPDGEDACPDEAEDEDGFEDSDGCPDRDNDGDGVPDRADACPNEPEDMDGYEDSDGCPDAFHDRDRDGVGDAEDKCPDEPETINGNEDEDGCPDRGIRRVEVTLEAIRILDKVFFATGRAVIKRRSHSLLNQVAQVIRASQRVRLLEVAGHTDDVGNDEDNQALSQARAEAVMAYLLKRGVEPERLQARGYGETKPLEDVSEWLVSRGSKRKHARAIRSARANNRRVEFRILEQQRTKTVEVEVDEPSSGGPVEEGSVPVLDDEEPAPQGDGPDAAEPPEEPTEEPTEEPAAAEDEEVPAAASDEPAPAPAADDDEDDEGSWGGDDE